MGSMEFETMCLYPWLSRTQIAQVAGRLINGIYLDHPLPPGLEAPMVRASQIAVGVIPSAPVFRLMRPDAVERFFEHGEIWLGSLRHWRAVEDRERQDATEGKFLLVGRNFHGTLFAQVGGGFDYRGLCCTVGSPSDGLLGKFGGAGFRIIDLEGFASSIANCLGATSYIFGRCVYTSAKVILDRLPDSYDIGLMNSQQILDAPLHHGAKLFVKPENFSIENELRILWRMESDVDSVQKVICPAAARYCERI